MSIFDLDSWREIAATLGKHRLRTALTGLGVFIGIVILLLMVGFGRSLEGGVKGKMAGFAANAVFAWGQHTSKPYAGLPPNRQVSFDNGDITALAGTPGIEYVAPRLQLGGFMQGSNVRYGSKTGSFQVAGDAPEFQFVSLPVMKRGRFLNQRDLDERRKVAVIGTGVVDQLYAPGQDPVGTYLQVNSVYFQVVGTFDTRQKGQAADRALNTIHLPFTTFQRVFNSGDRVHFFAITGKPEVSAEGLEASIKATLASRHQVDPTDPTAIGAWNTGREFAKMTGLFDIFDVVFWFAGIMTLAAGVIGVSNIMLISVRERTREIGVRKALGATPGTIITMIVTEAVVLTTVAGTLGIMAGVGLLEAFDWVVTKLGDSVPLGPVVVPMAIPLAAGAVLILFGALAGVIPAYHAARVEPVEALRTE